MTPAVRLRKNPLPVALATLNPVSLVQQQHLFREKNTSAVEEAPTKVATMAILRNVLYPADIVKPVASVVATQLGIEPAYLLLMAH